MSKKGLDTSNRSGVLVGSVVVAAVVIILVVLALTGVFSPPSTNTPAAQKTPAHNNAKDPNNNAQVQAPNAQPQTPAQTSTQGMYPFGKPSGGVAINVPPPPGQPTLSPTIATKTTTRLYGEDPFEEAVSITQHVWPAARSLTTPSGKTSVAENNNDPDRPWGLTLLTPDDPLTAITAVPLIHFPDDAPVLYVTKNGIPEVTLNEIKRLGDTGISRQPMNNADAFLVGAAANPAVENQLKAIGMKYMTVTGSDVFQLSNNIDK